MFFPCASETDIYIFLARLACPYYKNLDTKIV